MNARPVGELAKSWVEAYNKGPGWVEAVCSPDIEWIEMPSQAFPKGRGGGPGEGFAPLLKAANGNLVRNPDRKIELVRAVACGDDEVAIEWTWIGSSPAGGHMELTAMSFLKFENDKVIREIDYCCYWEMPEKPENFFNPDGTWRIEAVK